MEVVMPILAQPRDLAELTEIDPVIPPGSGDRFSGYGVMGLPFRSGQVLALRRVPASSLGSGYSTVWHRDAKGCWTFWSDHLPHASCARFFGSSVDRTVVAPVRIRWTGPRSMRVVVGDGVIDWSLTLKTTPATLLLMAARAITPDSAWQRESVLRAVGRIAGPVFRAGQLRLTGHSSNGQHYMKSPERAWLVNDSEARIGGVSLGTPGPLRQQAFLGDFAIPQRGIFMVGQMHFERFDPSRHSEVLSRSGTAGAEC
jgi:hypothetical protein